MALWVNLKAAGEVVGAQPAGNGIERSLVDGAQVTNDTHDVGTAKVLVKTVRDKAVVTGVFIEEVLDIEVGVLGLDGVGQTLDGVG